MPSPAPTESESVAGISTSNTCDHQGNHQIVDLPRTGLDSVLRAAAQHIGLKEVFAGKCLVTPQGVPADLREDSVIRFQDPHTRSDVSVWFKYLYSDHDRKETRGMLIDGIFARRHYEFETATPMEQSMGEMAWEAIIAEPKKMAKDAASPFAWWRASLRGTNTEHLESNVSSLIAGALEAASAALMLPAADIMPVCFFSLLSLRRLEAQCLLFCV